MIWPRFDLAVIIGSIFGGENFVAVAIIVIFVVALAVVAMMVLVV